MRFGEVKAEWLLEILKTNLEHLESFRSDDASVSELKDYMQKKVSEIEHHALREAQAS